MTEVAKRRPFPREGPCPTPRKARHLTEESAQHHIDELNAAGLGSPDLAVYRCDCGFLHCGHSRVKFEARLRQALGGGGRARRLA